MVAIGIMLAALAVQAGKPLPAAPSTTGDGDIVVLAHRLKKVRWEFEAKDGTLSKCEIKRTSGSALVDSLVCRASAQCAAEQPSFGDAALVPCIRNRVTRLYAAR